MIPREVTVAARAAAVMVRVHGPDPKGKKMRNHAFHHSESGDTTLSASGWLLREGSEDDRSAIVVTCASIIEPFLQTALFQEGERPASEFQRNMALIPGAEVDVLVEDFEDVHHDPLNDTVDSHLKQSSCWLPVKLVGLVDVPLAGTALQGLLDAHGGSLDGAWEVGWALAHADASEKTLFTKSFDLPAAVTVDEERSSHAVAFAMTRVAVLGIHGPIVKITSQMVLAEPCKRGDSLLVVGSPFGALSPVHFFNSIVVGIAANCWPPASSQTSLLMADLRCLPGMEGAPTFNKDGAFVGILARPLRQRGGGAEVQLIITWEALAPTLRDVGINLQAYFHTLLNDHPAKSQPRFGGLVKTSNLAVETQRWDQNRDQHMDLSSGISRAVVSVVLVTVGDGAWASGVLVNDKGLILTNAHLLEPWRFGKTQLSESQSELAFESKNSKSSTNMLMPRPDSSKGYEELKEALDPAYSSAGNVDGLKSFVLADQSAHGDGLAFHPALEINYRSYRKIRVRLEHPAPRSWYDARAVYVSRGPLDVALLQLDRAPDGLLPIRPEEDCPFPGSSAIVIGHGLFGPRSELCPSLSAGVVSRVVKAGNQPLLGSSPVELPAMLETTAAVHPGGSGGAVVNEYGRMIGLVTSNARHSGGAVIPHLNFSIPYAALKPIFLFAMGDSKDPSSLAVLGNPNEQLSAVWALVPPTPPRPTQVLPFVPELRNTDGSRIPRATKEDEPNKLRGTRFAKFLAEKKLELSKQSHVIAGHTNQASQGLPSDAFLHGQIFHSRL